MTAKFTFLFFLISFSVFGQSISDYRVGDEWGKKKVTIEVLTGESDVFRRAALATAYLPIGGTAFYLGKFNGNHVIATNHHVCPIDSDCVGTLAYFQLLNKYYRVRKLLITLEDIDLALLTIRVPASDEPLLAKIAQNFSFQQEVEKGTPLLTMGFGIGGNPHNNLMYNEDSDCKVFSENSEYVFMADPDDINPGYYKAWSFAHGCDTSHGDSGSAIIERNSGAIIGITWTGKIPKSPISQHSDKLNEMFETSSASIWKELSYAVPSVKIGEYLERLSQDKHIEESTRDIFKALLE